jgi:hypothetical protein
MKTKLEKNIFEIINNMKSSNYNKSEIIVSLKQIKEKKKCFLKLMKIQEEFLGKFRNYLSEWLTFLKKIQEDKKVDILFFLFIYKYLHSFTNREKSLKKASKLFFGYDSIDLFTKSEIEIMLEDLNKKFDLDKVFDWLSKNQKIFQKFNFEGLEKIIYFNKFEKDKDIDILHKFTKNNFKPDLFKSLQEVILEFLNKKKSKGIKYRCREKKKIMKGIKDVIEKTNLFGFNDFFEKILKVFLKDWTGFIKDNKM